MNELRLARSIEQENHLFGRFAEAEVQPMTSAAGTGLTRPGRRIVITTWGSLGDLHPYLAIGMGLKARAMT